MKTIFTFLTIIVPVVLAAQDQCKVKPESLQGTYTGDCKNGLAHGSGIAIGEDQYGGEFRKGLPHGEGVYTWSNGDVYEGNFRKGLMHGKGKLTRIIGGKEVVLAGVWRAGEYTVEQQREKDYIIERQRSIDYVRVSETGQGQKVRVKIWRSGSPMEYFNLRAINSSGTQMIEDKDILFDFVDFPFTFTVYYTALNKMKTAEMNCELTMTINKEGSWEVITVH
ncbi:MAG: hypothetical protein ACOCX0_01580 [Bacteroidota bacterium]